MRRPARWEDRTYCQDCNHSAEQHAMPGGCTRGWFCSCTNTLGTVNTHGVVRTGRPVWNAVLSPATSGPGRQVRGRTHPST